MAGTIGSDPEAGAGNLRLTGTGVAVGPEVGPFEGPFDP